MQNLLVYQLHWNSTDQSNFNTYFVVVHKTEHEIRARMSLKILLEFDFLSLWSQPRAQALCSSVDGIRSSVAHLELLVMINFPCDADMQRAPSPSFLGKTNAHTWSKENQTLQNSIIILMQRLTDDLTDFWVPRTSAGAEPLAVLLLGRCSLNCRGKMSRLKNFSSKTLKMKLKCFFQPILLCCDEFP